MFTQDMIRMEEDSVYVSGKMESQFREDHLPGTSLLFPIHFPHQHVTDCNCTQDFQISVREVQDGTVGAEDPTANVPQPLLARTIMAVGADSRFWWMSVGYTLGTMLQKAGYSAQSRQKHLDFFRKFVAPSMGSQPDSDGMPRDWFSFMTDDFSPAELSWSWKEGQQLPAVRYAIEPIGHWAGTSYDPLNLYSAKDFISRTQDSLHKVDFDWLKLFSRALLVSNTEYPNLKNSKENIEGEGSQTFLAYDLKDEETSLKAYFIPSLKAKRTGKSKLQLIRTAMEDLSDKQPEMVSAFNVLARYIDSREERKRLEVEIVAIDCVRPSESRVKIYVRCRITSFDSVVDIMTMGGMLDSKPMRKTLASLKDLWSRVLGLDHGFSTSAPLKPRGHRTAGILYYFELKPGSALPSVKLYIPVKHYGVNDLEVAKGLSGFLEARGNGFIDADYLTALQQTW